MSFYAELNKYLNFDVKAFFNTLTEDDILRALNKPRLTPMEYLTLLSPQAEKYLEEVAQQAHRLTVRNFGKTMQLFTPLYLANYCDNHCVYCGFKQDNQLLRKKLSITELIKEAEIIAESSLKHILILTGESRKHSSVEYIRQCVEVLKRYFVSVSIEIYPLTEPEYKELRSAGVDGLTMFQEVYNFDTYLDLHPAGPKRNYSFRLEAPERACRAGLRTVGIGALLGLADWRREAFITGLHADYLQRRYPDVEISISIPRVRPYTGESYLPAAQVTDKNLVQYITAFRLFMPRGGITLSTREQSALRDNLIRLGVTKMSAGVSTQVGGRAQQNGSGQFEIADNRSVDEMSATLYNQGYQPVYKDWH